MTISIVIILVTLTTTIGLALSSRNSPKKLIRIAFWTCSLISILLIIFTGIDGIISKENASKLESQLNETDQNLDQTKKISELTSLISKAQNDDRWAYEELVKQYGKHSSRQLNLMIFGVFREIELKFAKMSEGDIVFYPLVVQQWGKKRELDLDYYKNGFLNDAPVDQVGCVDLVIRDKALPEKDKKAFCIYAIQKTDSLKALHFAALYLSGKLGVKWKPFRIEEFLDGVTKAENIAD